MGVGCEVAILSSSVVRVRGLFEGPSVVAEVNKLFTIENKSLESEKNNK